MISIIDSNGQERFLGNIVPTAGLQSEWPVYGDVPKTPMYTVEELRKTALRELVRPYYLPPNHDQNGVGMCNMSGTAGAMEGCRAKRGLEYRKLSAGFGYGLINGGSDRGSLLEDGIAEAMETGLPTTNTVPYLNWRLRPASAYEEAKNYRVTEAFLCPTPQHCHSAAAAGFDLILGTMWEGHYNPQGKFGRLPRPRGGGGGHAYHGFGLILDDDGSLLLPCHQSWGRWGPFDGLFSIGEEHMRGPVGGWWAVADVTTEAGDIPAPVR
jgi:hypothetical protein